MITIRTLLSRKNKELEAKIVAALRVEPIERAGGRTTPRSLTFQVTEQKEAINARMRVYNAMKKIGEPVVVHMDGMKYAK